jgi:hypothetical protein
MHLLYVCMNEQRSLHHLQEKDVQYHVMCVCTPAYTVCVYVYVCTYMSICMDMWFDTYED